MIDPVENFRQVEISATLKEAERNLNEPKPTAEKIREQQNRWREAAKAMRENIEAEPNWRRRGWIAFALLGCLALLHFASLALSDQSRFRDGISVLGSIARQILLLCIIAFLLRKASRRLPRRIRRRLPLLPAIALAILLFVGVIFLRGAIGFLSGIDANTSATAIWSNVTFLLSLGVEMLGIYLLFRARRWCEAEAEEGREGLRLLAYTAEALILYLFIGFLYQALLFVDVPAILGAIFVRPKAIILFCLPIGGYIFFRRYFAKL